MKLGPSLPIAMEANISLELVKGEATRGVLLVQDYIVVNLGLKIIGKVLAFCLEKVLQSVIAFHQVATSWCHH